MKYDWYEAWADESPTVPYVLLVFPDPDRDGGVIVVDPKEENKVVYQSPDYENAKMWLLEDEYTQILGRVRMNSLNEHVVLGAGRQEVLGIVPN